MSDTFSIRIDNGQIAAALHDLAGKMSDMTPAMRSISLVLLAGIDEAFQRQASPATGTPWQKLQASTIARRTKLGKWPGKILQQTGRLVSSFTPDDGPLYAAAGTNVVYATTMNFGAKAGEFGATQRGSLIPWGDIPARPFAEISPAVVEDVLDVVASFLSN